jgi:hypothetical protein
MLGSTRCGSQKKDVGTRHAKLVFLHPVGSTGNVVQSVSSGCETSTHHFLCLGRCGVGPTKSTPGHVTTNLCFSIRVDALFFELGWAQCGSHKKRAGTRRAELVFLHPVRFVGHVVRSGASGARNVDVDVSLPRRTRTHNMTHRYTWMQKHKFSATCPNAFLWDPGPPDHEK